MAAMHISAPSGNKEIHFRRPIESQKDAGGNMSMTFLACPQNPRKFVYPQQQLIKGLNVETITGVFFPPPTWITSQEYNILQAKPDNDNPNWCFFSLNLPMYDQILVPSDWDGMWFSMNGHVHPYALTWEVLSNNTNPSEGVGYYTIPALIVRDQSYEPITPRFPDIFPTTPPVVSFTGPIIGPGNALLCDGAKSNLGNIQLKCCGFIQLSSFLTPGDLSKTPFKGVHPFQVFVIFPIHARPWTSFCIKMIKKNETEFQPNTIFSCTGKVAGFLDHSIMISPPQLAQDRIFIVVPDNWQFYDKTSLDSVSISPSVATPAKQPSMNRVDMAKFISPSKQVTQQATTPTTNTTSFTEQTSHTEPTSLIPCSPIPTTGSASTKRSIEQHSPTTTSTPSKKPRTLEGSEDLLQPSDTDSTATFESMPEPRPQHTDAPQQVEVEDDTTRPHRKRKPPTKYSQSK